MAVSERDTVRKIAWRLMPLLVFCYFIAILDRANVGVAALTMNHDLGLNASAFGLAAGVFFIPYVLLELPSNLALARFGARIWMARIMFTWGIFAAAHAFIWNAQGLYVVRALLGAAEAGFFPGVVFYLTLWFPSAYRGRIVAAFMIGIPVALVIGTPISSLLLGMNGIAGLKGWQWMFLIEAVPALLVAVAIPFLLPSGPDNATFLSADERVWLRRTLDEEQALRELHHGAPGGLLKALLNPRLLLLALAYYGLTNLNGAVSTFLPLILKEFGLNNVQTGFLAAVPYAFGALGMVVFGRLADRPGRRLTANYACLAIAFVGLLAAGSTDAPMAKLVALCFAATGVFGAMPVFWGLPTAFLSGAAAAGGLALINALGNLSSVINPWVIGIIRDRSGSFNGGLFWLAAMAMLSILVITAITQIWGRPERQVPSMEH
jgi:ACS family tartrate transporter-like MFS transporter